MKSMTGYGKYREITSVGTVTVELISVNHRNLDIRLRLPEACHFLEIPFRSLLKKRLRRGHVDGFVKIEKEADALSHDIHLNEPVARAYLQEAKRFLESESSLSSSDFSWIFTRSDVWKPPEIPEDSDMDKAITPVFQKALELLVHSRAEEGKKLKAFFEERVAEMVPILKDIDVIKAALPRLAKENLVKRLEELSLDPHINPDRLAQEVTYLAQRSDIAEEVSRLHAHLDVLTQKIQAPDVNGRELDFLLQEMNREVNTMGSKSITHELTNRVLRLKEILNQIREQVQNVE